MILSAVLEMSSTGDSSSSKKDRMNMLSLVRPEPKLQDVMMTKLPAHEKKEDL